MKIEALHVVESLFLSPRGSFVAKRFPYYLLSFKLSSLRQKDVFYCKDKVNLKLLARVNITCVLFLDISTSLCILVCSPEEY